MTGTRTRALIGFAALAAASTLALTGCTTSVELSADPDAFADLAASALEQSVGVLPEMDCGSERIAIVEGNEVPCTVIDPGNGEEYDAAVTVSEVEGSDYRVSVQVADSPN